MKIVLSSAYWPNLHYFYYVLHADEVSIEQHDNYEKQSYRNRTRILSANGPLDLCIPVSKKQIKEKMSGLEISYLQRWQHNHWGAIKSAYSNSPYFDFFESDIFAFYDQHYDSLLDYNTQQVKCVLKLLRVKKDVQFTETYEVHPENAIDLRSLIHPKRSFTDDETLSERLSGKYYQTFGEKFEFAPNLSILDLLFNKGLESRDYLGV